MANREKVEMVTDVTFLGSKITADGEFRHEIKRHLLLGRKAMTGLDSILKRRAQSRTRLKRLSSSSSRDQFIGRISVNMAVFFLQKGDFFSFVVEGVL